MKLNIRVLDYTDLDNEGFERYIPRMAVQIENIKENVLSIINNVKLRGDDAIIEYSQKFDGVDLDKTSLKVSEAEIEEAYNLVSPRFLKAMRIAIKNIRKFHKAQLRNNYNVKIINGVVAGQIFRPIESVGIYVPGGRAVYPSTVLMTALPAKVAKVERIILCSPPKRLAPSSPHNEGVSAEKKGVNGEEAPKVRIGIDPSILVAAHECGVDEIYKVGGAQAIAAMAYGTETIKPVLKIVGPGNKYVNAAKQLVSNDVSIDTPAGPSEVAIVPDLNADVSYIVADLFAQLEHGDDNIGVIFSYSDLQIQSIITQIEKEIESEPRKEIIKQNLEKNSMIVKTLNLDESIRLANKMAPEHLELLLEDYKNVLGKVKNAGAIFLGYNSPVPLGDYCAGTNHVLPTGGTAKRMSGLNTMDFIKTIDVLECNLEGLKVLRKTLEPMAEFEGLIAHKNAVLKRIKNNNDS
ncbi:MAG: histidinol dehydrogenase [Promethearchaeota archaeon]